jgi:hypothetical protein
MRQLTMTTTIPEIRMFNETEVEALHEAAAELGVDATRLSEALERAGVTGFAFATAEAPPLGGPDLRCGHCNEPSDLEDVEETTHQQWRCPCCGSWNDR